MSKTIWDSVVDDMKARDQFGFRKYGRHLELNDGRDTLKDAYEEALDLAVYLKKAIMERDTCLASSTTLTPPISFRNQTLIQNYARTVETAQPPTQQGLPGVSSVAGKSVATMLCLSRRIAASESITIRVHYRKSKALAKILEDHGICLSVLDSIKDVIQVEPLKMAWIKGESQVIIGVTAEEHVQIVRNEIDKS